MSVGSSTNMGMIKLYAIQIRCRNSLMLKTDMTC